MSIDLEACSLAEAIREMMAEFKNADHFIINPRDAEEADFPKQYDDKTGDVYYLVDGFRVYPTDDCPEGLVGACVADSDVPTPIGQA